VAANAGRFLKETGRGPDLLKPPKRYPGPETDPFSGPGVKPRKKPP